MSIEPTRIVHGLVTNGRFRAARVSAGFGVLVVVALLLIGSATASASGTFNDTDGNIHEGNIEAIAAAGITRGCNPPVNTRYCPDETVSRGAMAAFLVRSLGLTDDGGKDWFVDDDGHIFEDDINRLAAAGITKGCNPPNNDRYCPDRGVTRAAMAAFLVRGFGYTDRGAGNLFVDDNGTMFENDIDKLGTAGVVYGCNPPVNNQFCPGDLVERDTMASMLVRALGLKPLQARRPALDEGSFDAVVSPGDSIQGVVDGLSEGSSVLIKAGTHERQSVMPKSGMTFVGEEGAVLDGGGVTQYAFVAWEETDADDVTIRGLEVKNYVPIPEMAAVTTRRSGWVVEEVHSHHNVNGSGIRVDDNGVIRNSVAHDNDRLGLKPSGDNILVEGNEVYANNLNGRNDPTWEAGGIKGGGNGLVFRNNHVYDNHGPGIWVDIGAVHVLYEGNLIENNTHSGIDHEISYDAVIRNNTIKNNAHGEQRGWVWGSGIQVRGPNVQIYGNTLQDNNNGIVLIENERGEGERGPYTVANVNVYGNVVINSGTNGGVRGAGPDTLFETSRFDRNQYRYDNPNGKWWAWDGSENLRWDSWVSAGNDEAGTLDSA